MQIFEKYEYERTFWCVVRFPAQDHRVLYVQSWDVRRPLEAAHSAHQQDQAGYGHDLLQPAGAQTTPFWFRNQMQNHQFKYEICGEVSSVQLDVVSSKCDA